MTFSDRLFAAMVAAKPADRRLNKGEWLAVAQRVFDAEQPKAAPRKKPVGEMGEEEWISSLLSEPHLEGVDVRREISKCMFWCKCNKQEPSRRRIVNWLNKAERVVGLKAQGATYANNLRPPPPTGPDGWMSWLETELATMSEEHPAHGQLLAALNCNVFAMMPGSYQEKCKLHCNFKNEP